jgi:predicted Zn-dependent peptidase
LTVTMPHTRSVAMGIFTAVGSRYETEPERGISHFIEHMLFKGTQRRPQAQQIAEAIEGLGGVMNASTGDEVTTYWAKVADHHLPVALDVLVDMFRHSVFDPDEIERERQVIIQEISRMMDVPDSWVHVLIQQLIWPQHPVGWAIAGTKESVAAITRQNILDYVQSTYTPRNTVISLAGNLDHEAVLEQLRGELGPWQDQPARTYLPAVDAPAGPHLEIQTRETEQAHLCVGLRGLPLDHPDRFKLRILNAVLGEGMSSRLFLDIRERRGLAYSVGSYTSYLRDTGALILFAGVPPQKAEDVVSAMMEQLNLLCNETVPQPELVKAKEFTKGRILLRMEDSFANAQWFGQQEVLDQKVLEVDQVIEEIEAVQASDVRRLARQLFATERLSLAAVGPFADQDGFKARLGL